jgi:M6 family metalloprotease-like protein
MKKLGRIFIISLFFFCNRAFALQPPTPEQVEEYRRDGTLPARIEHAKAFKNHILSEDLVARARYKLQRLYLQTEGMTSSETDQILAPPPAWRGMPTKGITKVLALLIAFNDYPPVTPASVIESKLFGDGSGGTPYESLRNYYRRSSYNKLEITGNVLGWYITSYPRSEVQETTQGRQNLIKEALNYYDSLGHDFTQYDNDGDGTIDYLIVIWAGPHGAWASFWWGYMTTFSDSTYRLDGKRLRTYSWQWELYNYPDGSFDTKVVIHETGHALGLPDYYDYDSSVGPKGGVGGIDMMDGNWGDHNCFSKFLLDWINPPVHRSGLKQITLNPSGTSEDALVVMPGALQGNQFFEFFMIQNRYRTNNDTPYPVDGLLIWHVDARLNGSGTNFLYNNSYTAHKLLRLMEADGLEEIETGGGRADAGDYYVAGKIFGNDTAPNSKRYNGTSTGVRVKDISALGTQMNFSVFIPVRTVDFDMDGMADITIYRTSSGAWYVSPSGGNPPFGLGWGGDPSDKPVAGDYDGDGKTDIAIYRAVIGAWFVYPSGGGAPYGIGWGGDPTDKPVPGDYDGDGKTDVAIYRGSNGGWYIVPSSGTSPYGVGWGGNASDNPVTGDFDGDGKADIAIYRTNTGAWYVIPSSGASPYGVDWGGEPTDKPVPGDYDGDGKTDIAVYRAGTGAWYIVPSSGTSPYGVGWGGNASDKPVPGDYDGDGKTDIAIYRTNNGAWYVIPSSGASPYGVGWGGNLSDIPVTTNLSVIE